MTEEEKKRLGLQGQFDAATQQHVAGIQSAGEQYQQGLQTAGEQYQKGLDQLADNYKAAVESAAQAQAEGNRAAEQSFADIALGIRRDYEAAQVEDAQRRAVDEKTVRFTGLTELASSLANLYGVGSLGSAHQQYQTFSRDWMQKADQDAKMRKARMDNLRERQRAMEAQLAQLRQGNINSLNQLRLQGALQDAQMRGNALNAGYNTAREVAGARYQTGRDVANAEYQGTAAGINAGMQEESLDMQRERLNLSRAAAASGGGAKTPTGNPYDIQVEGRNVRIYMPKEAREQAVRDSKDEFIRDIMAMAGWKGSKEEFLKSVKEEKVKENYTKKNGKLGTHNVDNPYYQYNDIVNAIITGGEDAEAAINQFYELHRAEMNNVNTRLLRASNGAYDMGEYRFAGGSYRSPYNDATIPQEGETATGDKVESQQTETPPNNEISVEDLEADLLDTTPAPASEVSEGQQTNNTEQGGASSSQPAHASAEAYRGNPNVPANVRNGMRYLERHENSPIKNPSFWNKGDWAPQFEAATDKVLESIEDRLPEHDRYVNGKYVPVKIDDYTRQKVAKIIVEGIEDGRTPMEAIQHELSYYSIPPTDLAEIASVLTDDDFAYMNEMREDLGRISRKEFRNKYGK